ncbi:MAG: outer membrane lipoprotein carrier protein LolA [Bacteroidia bacterium]|nr:outer membrane lipoprotein carrier protein LolA [Bacteroidia bacterium]
MKKTFLLFFLAIVTMTISIAQTNEDVDRKAKNILKKVSEKFRRYKSIKATFLISIENQKDKSSENQKGIIQLKGDKYRLHIANQDIISDGKTVWTYMKDANEIQINNASKDTNAITPANFLTLYEKGFLFKFIGEEKEKGMVYQLVELVPVDPKKKSVVKVKLRINKKEQMINTARLIDKNGTVIIYKIENLFPDSASADSLFNFNVKNYPGAEVIDLR